MSKCYLHNQDASYDDIISVSFGFNSWLVPRRAGSTIDGNPSKSALFTTIKFLAIAAKTLKKFQIQSFKVKCFLRFRTNLICENMHRLQRNKNYIQEDFENIFFSKKCHLW